ncbi:hypothetical protein [Microbacterium sp. 1P10AE]
MIVVGLVAIGVDGPLWFALIMLFAGAIIAGIAIIRLALLRRN